MLAGKLQSRRPHRRSQIFQSLLQVIVDYNEIELLNVTQLAEGGGDPALDYLLAILPSSAQTAFKLGNRGRNYENAYRLGNLGAYLLSTLPVNLQQGITTGTHFIQQPGSRGTVEIAMHLSPLEKITALAHCQK